MGELIFCFCLNLDVLENLTAAGTFHVSTKKTDSLHVQNLTQKWKKMAAVTNNNELLRKLAFDDVTSNELFYHQNCYSTFKNDYRGKLIGMVTKKTTIGRKLAL